MTKYKVSIFLIKTHAFGTTVDETGRIEVELDDINIIHKALDMLKVKTYEISDLSGGVFGEVIYKTEDIIEIEEQRKRKQLEYDEKQRRLVQEFNSLPKILKEWQFGQTKIWVERTDAAYNRQQSSRLIGGGVYLKIEKQGKEPTSFWPSNYITQDGKIQRKKFIEWHPDLPKTDAEEISFHLKEFHDINEEYRRKYNLR